MTTLVARCFAATPQRTGSETWAAIVDLVSSEGSTARKELQGVAGIAASVIVGDVPTAHPFIIFGNGPRLRVYCVYGENAVTGENCDEDALSWVPADGDWNLHIPCEPDEIGWMTDALKAHPRVAAYDISTGEPASDEQDEKSRSNARDIKIDVEKFKRS